MSDCTAEIAALPFKPGTDLTTGPSAKIWAETLTTITSQPGCKAVHWGRQVERPDVIQLAVEWSDHAAHQSFIDSPGYGPFVDHLSPLLAGPADMHHIPFSTSSPVSPVLSAPVTECINLYFPSDPDPVSTYHSCWLHFVTAVEKTAKEAKGITGGWAIEEQPGEKLGEHGKSGKAKLFGAFIGWPSVQAHMEYREDDAFPGAIKWLREGPKKLEVHHVEFEQFTV